MNTFHKSIAIAVASLGFGTAALAAPDTGALPSATGFHRVAFGTHGPKSAERLAKRQAALHDKLSLTAAQEPAWKAFTDRMQAAAPARPDVAPPTSLTAPERADRMTAFLQQAQQSAATRAQAVKEFYAVLSPEQQKTFDSQFHGRHHHSHHG